MRIIQALLLIAALALPAYAYDSDSYVAPDSWSQHVTANGVRASTQGVKVGSGILKMGLTTRGYFNIYDSDNNNSNVYQYFRARLSGAEVGDGVMNLNVNLRGAWNGSSRSHTNAREYYVFYDPLDMERDKSGDFSLRVYQANINLHNVIKNTDLKLGRLYLDNIGDYKIDGLKVAVNPAEYLTVGAYYGLPVSYYSNLMTQLVGAFIEVPIEQSQTKIRAEYSYFLSSESGDYNTQVIHGRVDQGLNFNSAVSGNLYLEGSMIGNAFAYDIGTNLNINPSRTGVSVYVMGQYDQNKEGDINPYIASFESMLGTESEYVMGGFLVSQGVTDYVMLALGYETRYNMNENYGDRDYNRVFATVDLIRLLHDSNFVSLVFDWYGLKGNSRQDEESKFLGGVRVTQKVASNIDLWMGANVMNYQFHNSPIKYAADDMGFATIDYARKTENNALAYLGGMWQVNDWCVVQLDYMFEYSSIFKSYDMNENSHTLEAWVNFLW